MAPPPTPAEEAKRYYQYVGHRFKNLYNTLLPPATTNDDDDDDPSSSTTHQMQDTDIVHDDVDSEDEGWAAIAREAGEAPQDNDQETVRLAAQGGPLRDTAVEFSDAALDVAATAARITGKFLKMQIYSLVSGTGWLSNCDTIDELTRRLRAKYPMLKLAGSAMKELQVSFVRGRQGAAEQRQRERTRALVREARGRGEEETAPVPVPRWGGDCEDFGALEEVPLLGDEVMEGSAELGRAEWERADVV
ncbi:hypothetical protein B0A55_09593 [Friedmanniomyces simplex]|uniref:Uncharacterized protein n=1 Tax=Friedmanniomyces simplex TaxID=329884 RepID=A0A4U0WSU8_9PEZI|nr:hypothetical protein B0A55_09593 [Friedmanniomyces simplex]